MKTVNIIKRAALPPPPQPARLPKTTHGLDAALHGYRRVLFRERLARWCGAALPWAAAIGLALLLFFQSGPLLRLLDPTAAVLDPGLISVLLFALLATLAFGLAAGLLLQLLLPAVNRVRHEQNNHLFQHLSPCQQICVCAGSYLGCLFAFVGVFTALL